MLLASRTQRAMLYRDSLAGVTLHGCNTWSIGATYVEEERRETGETGGPLIGLMWS